jgi:hypothetical protein
MLDMPAEVTAPCITGHLPAVFGFCVVMFIFFLSRLIEIDDDVQHVDQSALRRKASRSETMFSTAMTGIWRCF